MLPSRVKDHITNIQTQGMVILLLICWSVFVVQETPKTLDACLDQYCP